jgi:DNA-binding transcriptional MocR family regulator
MLLPIYNCLVSLQCTLSKSKRKDIMQLAEACGAYIVQVEAYDAIDSSARKKEVLVVVDNPSTWKHESKDGERVVSVD